MRKNKTKLFCFNFSLITDVTIYQKLLKYLWVFFQGLQSIKKNHNSELNSYWIGKNETKSVNSKKVYKKAHSYSQRRIILSETWELNLVLMTSLLPKASLQDAQSLLSMCTRPLLSNHTNNQPHGREKSPVPITARSYVLIQSERTKNAFSIEMLYITQQVSVTLYWLRSGVYFQEKFISKSNQINK